MAVRERIYLTKAELEHREMAILNDRHIERYGMIRQWCHCIVVDFGSGCGYGTYMISRNPDVRMAVGYDIDISAVRYATSNYEDGDRCYYTLSLTEMKADTLVALEVMEHIEDRMYIPRIADHLQAKTVIVSYPSKKTTHYNPHHYHDFTKDDMYRMWEEGGYPYRIVEFIELYREHMIVRLERV
jgi:2-polyprenyl-3-methyl-5-hydroxy-6-metoxy-1,4-benzoquinol methylase